MKFINSLKATAMISILAFVFMAVAQPDDITIYLIGDSTMAVKEVSAYPETGWGMPFVNFFNSTVTVENHAKNGRSTRAFLEEGRWQPIVDKLEQGDYVFIQFGHNDESKAKKDRYTTENEFKANLLKYVSETRARGATPVLLTPVSRRKFDPSGNVVETHEVYSGLVREVAEKHEVPMIDLDRRSQALLQELGPDKSRLLFLQLEPGEHPNYPDGIIDNTHFNELGARKIAQLVVAGMKDLELDLCNRIREDR